MLRAGGKADHFAVVKSVEEIIALSSEFPKHPKITFLGYGSNVLVSDAGLRGLTLVNRSGRIRQLGEGRWEVDCGAWFQDLALVAAQAGFEGLEFAVGIPGSVGGALVSNAGAYRSSIGEVLTEVHVLDTHGDRWVDPGELQLTYRDSLLRRNPDLQMILLAARIRLKPGEPHVIFQRMKDFQRQRIRKQPPCASAGSFFKNINDSNLAQGLEKLPEALRQSGVVPAGFLIEMAELRGLRVGGASVGMRHANFILNDRGATAGEIRTLAETVKGKIHEKFGVLLEEEVLYLGDWSGFAPYSLD